MTQIDPARQPAAELTHLELAGVAEVMTAAGVEVDGALHASLITGGRSNLTFRLSDDSSRWVLRTPPRAGRTPSAHDVGREFRVTRALGALGVPVPPAVVLCQDESVIGAPFAVAGFVDGRTVQTRADLDLLDDTTVHECVDRMVEALAGLHAVDHVSAGLERFGRPYGYSGRQVARWSSQWELVGTPGLDRAAAEVAELLSAAVPEQRSVGIVHGDFRIDNTILRLDGRVRLAAIVDWELSTIGDPVADVALMCVYRHPALDLVLGAPSAWTSDRLPAPDELAAKYEAAGGVELAAWEFHLALGYFKLAVIAAGIDHRFRAGATHGSGFDSAGDAVGPLLEAGRALVSKGR
ncbi:MAG TPA: phosphotransferase family protein [Pedococcus sp.]|jgi:aminoglycoside phosphotransferase (APT) family kinase protein|nr:phosphotransferase family protein [Pedococcus sp.]